MKKGKEKWSVEEDFRAKVFLKNKRRNSKTVVFDVKN
jgi:hypothetical protein